MKQEKIGTFIKIPLIEGQYAYARIIINEIFSFYKIEKAFDNIELLLDAIANASPIFNTHVFDNVFRDSSWEVIGWRPLEDKILNDLPVFFRQDIGNWEECLLVTTEAGFQKPITQYDCIGMERSAVWEFEAIEERLNDYFSNRPNKQANRQKIQFHYPFQVIDIDNFFKVIVPVEEKSIYEKYQPIFEEYGYEGNGYTWEGHIKLMFEKIEKPFLQEIEFDSEAGLFCANFTSKYNQLKFIRLLYFIFNELDILSKWVAKADRQLIDD